MLVLASAAEGSEAEGTAAEEGCWQSDSRVGGRAEEGGVGVGSGCETNDCRVSWADAAV